METPRMSLTLALSDQGQGHGVTFTTIQNVKYYISALENDRKL